MRKLKLLLAAFALFGVSATWAEDVFKDVTSTYLTNADFEGAYSVHKYPRGDSNKDRAIYLPTGWTINYQSGKEWDMTALKSGDLSWSSFSSVPSLGTGGTQTYRIRFNNSYKDQRLELSQSATLPKSIYKLEASWYISRTDAGDGYIKIGDTRYNASTASSWQNFSQSFTSTGTAITFLLGAYHSATTEKFYAFDNFKIYWNLTQSLLDLIEDAEDIYVAKCTLDGMTTMKTALDDANNNKTSTDPDVLEAKYNALNDALPLAIAAKTYWTAKTAAETARDHSDYVNVVGTELTALNNAINAAVTNSIEWYNSQATTINDAKTAFTGAKAYYDLNAAEVTRATALGVASATVSTYTAGSTTTSATALTNTQALKVAEYDYVTTNFTKPLTLGDWTGSKVKDESTQPWDGSTGYKASNGYDDGSWNSSYSQTFDLAAGTYVFKVAGRRSNSSAMSIEVKKGEDVLGAQNDFPKASTGLGINLDGNASFDGEDAAGFANSNNGYGWEWRYIKFSLAEKATVTVAIKGSAGVSSQWINFANYQVLADNAVNVSFYEYYKSLNKATAARDNSTYTNVQGTDRSGLESAIGADPGSTTTTIDAAKGALDAAYTTFTAGVASWNGYALEKGYAETAATLAYATTAKKDAVTTAKNATINTAAEALAQTPTIATANRQAYESHALAEGVVGAENKTALISDPNMDVTYDGTAHTFGAWAVFGQTDGEIQLKDETESLTDGDGNAIYKYANIWKSDNNAGIKQTLTALPAGKYILTVAARAQNTAEATFEVFAGSARQSINRINASGGVYGWGWNDASVEFNVKKASDVEIGVQSGNGRSLWWSATRFRLVRLGNAVENISVSAAGMATYVSDYDLDYTSVAGLKAYKATVSGTTATFTQVTTVPAGEGVLLEGAEGSYNIPVTTGIAAWADSYNDFIRGTGEAVATGEGDVKSYILSTDNDGNNVGFYYANGETVPTNRAYLQSTVAASRLTLVFEDEATGITDVRGKTPEVRSELYDLSGRRVAQPAKGLYIQNGKKVFIK